MTPEHARSSTRWSALVPMLMFLAVAGPLLFGLPVPGYLSGSDGNFALDLTRGYMASIHAGQWFPRWLSKSNAGFGSPVFYFYGRLPFLIAALLGLGLHLGPVNALLMGFASFRTLAFFTCRTWLRQVSSLRAADCGALAFVALPFAMSLNPVTRIGFAETAATAFLPLLFLALDGLPASRGIWLPVAGLGATYAMLAWTHPPQLLLAAGVTFVYATARRSGAAALANLLGLSLGLLLAATSVLPALLLQSTVSAAAWSNNPFVNLGDNLLFTAARFHLYGLYALDLELYSTWFLCAGVLWLCARQRGRLPAAGQARQRALVVSLAFVLLAMTGIARPFWLSVGALRIIQFPWRLFPGALAMTAALIALWVSGRRRRQHIALSVLACLTLCQTAAAGAGAYLSRSAFRAHHRVPVGYTDRLPVYVSGAQRALPAHAQKRSFVPEYLPAGARKAGWHIGPNEEFLLPGAAASAPSAAWPAGLSEAFGPENTLLLSGRIAVPQSVVLPMFYFPDEAAPGISASAVRLDPATGLARLDLPAGPVAFRVTHTRPLRAVQAGHLVSTAGAFLLFLCLMLAWRQEWQPGSKPGLFAFRSPSRAAGATPPGFSTATP